MHTNTHMPIQMPKCTHMQTKETRASFAHAERNTCICTLMHTQNLYTDAHTCIQMDMFTYMFTDEYAWTHTLRTWMNQHTHSLKTQINQRPRNLLSSSLTIAGSHCLPRSPSKL